MEFSGWTQALGKSDQEEDRLLSTPTRLQARVPGWPTGGQQEAGVGLLQDIWLSSKTDGHCGPSGLKNHRTGREEPRVAVMATETQRGNAATRESASATQPSEGQGGDPTEPRVRI